jgi:hypothetical protein
MISSPRSIKVLRIGAVGPRWSPIAVNVGKDKDAPRIVLKPG